MGQPDWSRIPFEKMPEWKREEILSKSKKDVKLMDQINSIKCEICGKEFKNKLGLIGHKRTHK